MNGFLQCHGRAVRKLVDTDNVIQIDALPLQEVHGHLPDGRRPQAQRKEVARQVADRFIEKLKADERTRPEVPGR